ncbi:MAG: 23S rRNA (pseudouridine(1915)-N(3))-methyltransferase RlmH [Anaerococcus sp.]|nr:23S rRNA (pseudouridine(1915)-N(3))-methyltransferase RlmH [Anaerococcus sp.]
MVIKIIGVGKIKEKFYRDAIDEYLKRMKSYNKVEIIEVNDERAEESLSEKELDLVKEKEGERILGKISEEDFVVSLEIGGKNPDSLAFADFIKDHRDFGFGKNLVFVIGGSNGLGQNLLQRSNKSLSFGKMTYPHQLMRVILLEQIYRSFRIINNHPYHK